MAPKTKRQKIAAARWAAGGFHSHAAFSKSDSSVYVPSDSDRSSNTGEVESESNEFLINLSDNEDEPSDITLEETGFNDEETEEYTPILPLPNALGILMEQATANTALQIQQTGTKVGRAPYTGNSRWARRNRALKEQAKAESVKDCKRINAFFRPLRTPEVVDLISEDSAESAGDDNNNDDDKREESESDIDSAAGTVSIENNGDDNDNDNDNDNDDDVNNNNNNNNNDDKDRPLAVPDEEALDALNEDEGLSVCEDVQVVIKNRLAELEKLFPTTAVVDQGQRLVIISQYLTLMKQFQNNPKIKHKSKKASEIACRNAGKKTQYFARKIRSEARFLLKHGHVPPFCRGNRTSHASLLDNELVRIKILSYLASLSAGEITPRKFRTHLTQFILPTINAEPNKPTPKTSISTCTALRWLRRLGYTRHPVKKGVYVDGHERPDVRKARDEFLRQIEQYQKFMCNYNEETMEPLPIELEAGRREHILVVQDESVFHANDQRRSVWLGDGQAMPLRQKGNGRAIHVSDFLDEKSETGRLSLTKAQQAENEKLSAEEKLKCTDVRKIIYPGKGKDDWWDMKQLLVQLNDAIDIFEFLHPGTVGVFVFDCSSAHEAFAENALNVNNMNVNPKGRGQRKLRDTIIPTDNPAPQHTGIHDTRGQRQAMVFPADHPDPALAGQPKGMLQVLRERESVWHRFTEGEKKKPIGHCQKCKLSQAKRDALARVAAAEDAGQDENIRNEIDQLADNVPPDADSWCCAKKVLSLQHDFLEEKPLLQHKIEERGHVCLFLPKFHCELNAIELYWGFAKYYFREASDGKFSTAQKLVPQCLDLCPVATIRRYFRKCWRYMDSYRKGLNFKETVYAMKKYKGHRCIPGADSVRELLVSQPIKAL